MQYKIMSEQEGGWTWRQSDEGKITDKTNYVFFQSMDLRGLMTKMLEMQLMNLKRR